MKKILLSAVLALSCWSGGVVAENRFDEVSHCLVAINKGDLEEARGWAEQILEWTGLTSETMAERSAKCLSVVYGEPFVYDALTNAFVSGSDIGKALTLDQKAANRAIAKQKLLDLQAETELRKQQLQAERKQAVVAGTVAACIELYGEDEVAALTNQICNPIFMQIGLPDLAGR